VASFSFQVAATVAFYLFSFLIIAKLSGRHSIAVAIAVKMKNFFI
jgi:hypothetical protein